MSAAEQFHVDEISPSYWRVTFDNGEVNLLDPDTVDQLGALIGRIEADPDLTVVVFRSDKPRYFMAHRDFVSDTARVARMTPGPTGMNPYLDNFVRLSRLPVATVSEIRGRTRGAGSEFVLATDIRFASDKAVLGQFEVGVGAVPGGGPMARLGRLVGRGRALEILLGDDITAALAAEYGYVNGSSQMPRSKRSPTQAARKTGRSSRNCSNGLQRPGAIEVDLGTTIGNLRSA
jgi:enoyl-CoA hydratase/carnithine racemase